MNRTVRYFLLFLFIFLLSAIFYGCRKTEKSNEQTQWEDTQSSSVYYIEENVQRMNMEEIKNLNLSFTADAHSKYLNDPLEFHEIPDGGIPEGATAVVGSEVCYFYPVKNISSDAETAKLPKGELIPFASIISLGDKLENNDSYNNWFTFQDNINSFYKTKWNGKDGIVFGADLYGINCSNTENRVNSLLYKNNGRFENFYPLAGYDHITPAVQKDIKTLGLAFQSVSPHEYELSGENPDDMISLYRKLNNYGSITPVFVTTDFAAHANHLIFSRTLQFIEEEYLFPQLVRLTEEYIKEIEEKKNQMPESVYNICILYFQTAKALLALAPDKISGVDYFGTIEYKNVDEASVLERFPAQIAAEINKMNNASGIDNSSVFPFLSEDYSQYKVRGHYTKNGVLGSYFRALMWYGRINFNLGGEGNIKEYALRMAPAALFITDITESSPNIKNLWRSLFDPVTELIGVSDDISFIELAPLWDKIKGAGFNQWYSDPEKLEKFITVEYSGLRPPSISGFSLVDGPYDGDPSYQDRKPPLGWRLFGQRYTLDNEIHHKVSPPRYYNVEAPRHMVQGLDIMKVFGSVTADWLLSKSDYPKHQGLEDILNSIQKDLDKLTSDYWMSTYYANNLYQIKSLAVFEKGTGFYFTERPGWNIKAMNSAHGAWAELRHDTILYVKQSYAEMGGGREEPTFRTKPLPEPVHYLEPNIPFWNTCVTAFKKLHEILSKYDYLDNTTDRALKGMQQLYEKAEEISMLETEDKEVSRSNLNWISRIANELSYRVMSYEKGNIIEDKNTLRMALAADVFTNAETGMVLETAVGIPYRLYIPLNDGQGGKRIAIGYGFSYYEFSQHISNRLNNEEWKEIVYSNNHDMNQYLPFWMKGIVQPPK